MSNTNALTLVDVCTRAKELLLNVPLGERLTSCAEACRWGNTRSRRVDSTRDIILGGARFCIWRLEHDGVVHWALTCQPGRTDEYDDDAQKAFVKAIHAYTNAGEVRVNVRRVMFPSVHWRWHDDGSAPSVDLLAQEVGVGPDWHTERATEA